MAENFPNFVKDTNFQTAKKKTKSFRKLKTKSWKLLQRNDTLLTEQQFKGYFSSGTVEATMKCTIFFKCWKKYQAKIPYRVNTSFGNKGEIKTTADEGN